MPRLLICLVGISLTALLAACGGAAATSSHPGPIARSATPEPTARSGPPRAEQALTFSGNLSGSMTQLDLTDPGRQSECTGPSSRTSGTWASTLYGHVSGSVYGLVVLVKPYRGPGTYQAPAVRVEVHTVDDKQVWQSSEGDPATVKVDAGQLTGSLQATLHDAATDQQVVRISGRFSCQP